MASPLFIFDYLSWHYTRAFRDIGSVWLNFMWFILHFFSIPLLLRTLFSPWRRVSAGHKKGDLEDYAQAIAFNLMSRLVGFLVRIVLVVVGLIALTLLILGFVVFLIAWSFLPFAAVFSMMWGFSLIIS